MQFRIGRPVRRATAGLRKDTVRDGSGLAARIQDCAVTGGQLVGSADPQRQKLAEAIRTLTAAYTAALSRPADAAALLADDRGWPKTHPELFDALLQTGRAAADLHTDAYLPLALRITDTLLGVRKESRAAWRLRARVLDLQGDDRAAIAAHERYLKICAVDDLGTGARISALRRSRERLTECLDLLQERGPGAAEHAGESETELWSRAGALRERGDRAGAEELMTAALLAMERSGRRLGELSTCLTTLVELLTESGETTGPRELRLLEAYSEHRRLLRRDETPEPLLGGTKVIGISDFRNLIAGKTVCLVANSNKIAESRMGEEIDSYDLVVRFNSFRIDPANTGRRTDIHATIHKHSYNWDVPVQTRLVFGGKAGVWNTSLRRRLVPGAQTYVNDRTLRWPLREVGKVPARVWPAIPTSGFNMLWLLDFLDVSPRIDLLGFDFYASGAYRLPDAMKHPITAVHEYRRERDWIMDRARHTDEMRIALR
ncbi:glycosyltransferase family 29 protein [Streptomyces aidingensis]|uniref:Glycosyltransferase family 29 (Sialyltransferase) n=1 Tax=Streptomyces aidingensis TaxID=910347 RepID=A0A1I1M5R3_9ACTN|nr:glycosyltransferase family 29 protein [Streptomyces aidingensis]SFC80565.1 Glycosyltransferase family 29 (sialyltransferase) [Streptomyces aidingensis]